MSLNCLIGTSTATEFPLLSEMGSTCPTSVGDVLSRLTADPLHPKICSALNRFAQFIGKPSQAREMSLDLVHERKPGFRPYLERHNYSDATICHYVQWVYLFLQHAESFGWIPDGNLSKEWREILAHPKMNRPVEIVQYFAARTQSPSEVTHSSIIQWVDKRVISGERGFEGAYAIANAFKRCLLELGYTQVDPVRAVRLESYGIALKDFPSPLKEQVEKLLAFRKSGSGDVDDLDDVIDDLEDLDLDDFRDLSESDESRPRHSQIRDVTARMLEESICRLYGYLRNKKKVTVTSLQMLFNPRVLESYRKWLRKERLVESGGMRAVFVPILTAMRQSREFDPKLLYWIRSFRDKLGKKPSQDEIRLKKAQRQLEYIEVAAIPKKIYLERARLAHKKVDTSTIRGEQVHRTTLQRLARLAAQELAIRWLLWLPWRQRNMREMRIDGPDPNLFKGRIPEGFEIDKPDWVVEELKRNPMAEFWLYRFTKEENKTGKLIFCVLPKPLVQPLEDFLANWRPILLNGKNAQTLFVNCNGKEMSSKTFAFMIYEVTLRFGGKRMNPHIFRDVFAFAYLKKCPRDFINLSIMLWHSSITTTMENYGGKFNASCGTAAVEAFGAAVGVS
jgi:hypothetical protein